MSEVQKTEIFQVEQNAVEKSGTSRKSNGRKWGIIGGVALVLIALIIGFSIYNSPKKRLSRQLDLGNRYLEEQNYEQAIVEFDKAIAIDSMSVDAYLGKAQAYESLGDEEKAIEVLQTGYEITGNSRLKKYMDKLSVGSGAEIQAGEDDDNYNAERIEELKQFLDEEWEEYHSVEFACLGYIDPHTWQSYGGHLSDEQIEELCRPLVNVIEEYIELTGDVKWRDGYDLGRFYYALGEYDKCLEVRRQWYELTGDVTFTPAEYTVEYKTDDSNRITTYDQYGNEIVSMYEDFESNCTSKEVYTYGDNGRLSRCDYTDVGLNGIETVSTYTYLYDADGRLVEEKYESNSSDGKWYTVERKYQYMVNKVVVHSHDDEWYFGASDHYSEYEIDEYGKRTYIGDYNGNNE